jgi:hypothetical protein
MNLAYVTVPVGIVLLCLPTTLISPQKLKDKMRQAARRHESGMGSIARARINWIDLFRAAAGAWMVQYGLPVGGSGDDQNMAFEIAQIAIFSLAVLMQTIWIDKPVRIIGPLFYFTGLSLVVCGPLVAGLAIALGLGCALMLRRLRIVFLITPAVLLSFAYLFREMGAMMMIMAGAFALPAFLSFALGIRIAFARRPATDTNNSSYTRPYDPTSRSFGDEDPGDVITTDFTDETAKSTRESIA